MKNLLDKIDWVKFGRRLYKFNRWQVYIGKFQMVFSLLTMLGVLRLISKSWLLMVIAIAIIFIMLILSVLFVIFVDKKYINPNEQNYNTTENPQWTKLMEKLDRIEKKL
jgi:hypothetical protein